jgi:hypothetical protein
MRRSEVLNRLGAGDQTPPVLVVENQTVKDIIALIKYKHLKCADDYDKISNLFWKGNIYDTAEALWNFAKKNIYYTIESEDIQTVSAPAVILNRGFGDCKHYSLFIAGILSSLQRKGKPVEWSYRFASYSILDPTPGHVFVIVKDMDGSEIWIDPVLDEFNFHKPYVYGVDKTVSTGRVGSLGAIHSVYVMRPTKGLSQLRGSEVVGAMTTAQTGQIIEKVAPSLAAIPVVGWIAAGVGTLGGFFLATFGSNYLASTQVRWLDQLFEYFVLNRPGVTSDNKVTESNIPMAHNWFATVLGVPVYDRLRFNSLAGATGSPAVDGSIQTRVLDYLKYPDVIAAHVTYNQAYTAAQIAGTMNLHGAPGSWAGMTAAASLIDYGANPVQPVATMPGAGGMSFVDNLAARFNIPVWMIYGAGGLLIYLLFFNKKHGHA